MHGEFVICADRKESDPGGSGAIAGRARLGCGKRAVLLKLVLLYRDGMRGVLCGLCVVQCASGTSSDDHWCSEPWVSNLVAAWAAWSKEELSWATQAS